MPFTWDDRFDARPGTFDPRFQGGTTTTSVIGSLMMIGITINSVQACTELTNLVVYRTEVNSPITI